MFLARAVSGYLCLHVNQYYEKNSTNGTVTTRYYSGGRLIAEREATTLRYFHQDSLSSTSLMTDASGNSMGTQKFYPFGSARSGSLPTDILFTGQRLDDTGLYYYGARYYDSNIGRFISPDTIVPDSTKPQALNRYSYVLNNPLKYVDPTGYWWTVSDDCQDIWIDDDTGAVTPGYEQIAKQAAYDKAQTAIQQVSQVHQLPLEKKSDVADTVLDVVQTVLDLAGLIPGAGEPFDAVNALIYTARGDYVNAGLSSAAVIPVVGWAGTGAKIVGKIDDVVDVAKGFDSSRALKKSLGDAGEGKEWHHIVEQSQIAKSGFNPRAVHNPANALAVDTQVHRKISGYYNSIDPRLDKTKRVRDYLAGKDYATQYRFGLDVLKKFSK